MSDKWSQHINTPGPGQPITVNVDDWLKERAAGPDGLKYPVHTATPVLPHNLTEEQKKEALETQHKMQVEWENRQARIERQSQLDSGPRTCVSCGDDREHYKNDYICYQCRDQLGGE